MTSRASSRTRATSAATRRARHGEQAGADEGQEQVAAGTRWHGSRTMVTVSSYSMAKLVPTLDIEKCSVHSGEPVEVGNLARGRLSAFFDGRPRALRPSAGGDVRAPVLPSGLPAGLTAGLALLDDQLIDGRFFHCAHPLNQCLCHLVDRLANPSGWPRGRPKVIRFGSALRLRPASASPARGQLP